MSPVPLAAGAHARQHPIASAASQPFKSRGQARIQFSPGSPRSAARYAASSEDSSNSAASWSRACSSGAEMERGVT